jgi:toxin YoeB
MIYKLEYTPEAEKDVKALQKSGGKAAILKLRKLLIELTEHPETGTGHPKPLGGDRVGQWSRRITDKDRLVYSIDEERIIVLIISTLGHYKDK